MNDHNLAEMSLAEFIRAVFLHDMRRMIYDANLHYLGFGVIASGIEFVGACFDEYPFHQERKSRPRFAQGMQWLSRIDPRYQQYNQPSSPYFLYKFLRCGMAHVMRPHGRVLFSSRVHWPESPNAHLSEVNNSLLLICEDFYDHFARGCEELIAELPQLAAPKLADPYLFVGPLLKRQ
jgi:hypothetical protein